MNTSPHLQLRPAVAADEARLLTWRNDPWILALGSLNRNVTADEHHVWFAKRITNARHPIWVIEIAGEPAGMVRLDPCSDPTVAKVSLYLIRAHCGQGHGRKVLALTAEAATNLGYRELHASVRQDNVRSQRAFLSAGYLMEALGEPELTMRLSLDDATAARPVSINKPNPSAHDDAPPVSCAA